MKTNHRLVCTLVTAVLSAAISFDLPAAEGRGPFPQVNLPAQAQGRGIPQALGAAFDKVARWYGKKPEDLSRACEHDNDLRISRLGRLHCTCAGLTIPAGAGAGGEVAAASFPLEQTFLLHSRPGATKVIYLDFNGHTTSGMHWNTEYTGGQDIVSPAYDIDGNAAQFSTTELENIQTIWQHVTEDFAPFDVDVTTEEPDVESLRKTSPTDDAYGQRVVIGGGSSWLGGSYGGVANVGSFDDDVDLPCYVFPAGLNNGAPKATAEAASHEAGHTLGLLHDGTVAHDGIGANSYYVGHGSWAPIMGVGYYKPVSHWSKGDYPWADNQEDDLAVMQTFGVALRADAHGNSSAAGTVLSGHSASLSSVIESRTDTDWFTFTTGGGNIYVGAMGALPSPNLDAELALFDDTGALVTTSSTASPAGTTLDAEIFTTVAAGTYHVRLDGIGSGTLSTGYDDYSSVGQYQLDTLTVPTSGGPPVAVADASGPVGGPAALTVNFSSAGSSDPNGSIVGYSGDFGDGQSSTQASPAHTYAAKGLYTATLVVTDNSGLPAMDFVTVNVTSALPVAVVNTIPNRGVAPQGIIITPQGSYDPDGTIVSYHWDFGDGQTSTVQSPGVHQYVNAGAYDVTLTLTDNDGAVGTDTKPVVIFPTNLAIYVDSINMSLNNLAGGFKSANASVKIVRFDGTPMRNANVTVNWTGLAPGTKTAKTNAQGIATITSNKSNASGTFTATVTNVVLTGNPYFAPGNNETSDSISTPVI